MQGERVYVLWSGFALHVKRLIWHHLQQTLTLLLMGLKLPLVVDMFHSYTKELFWSTVLKTASFCKVSQNNSFLFYIPIGKRVVNVLFSLYIHMKTSRKYFSLFKRVSGLILWMKTWINGNILAFSFHHHLNSFQTFNRCSISSCLSCYFNMRTNHSMSLQDPLVCSNCQMSNWMLGRTRR